MRRSGDRVRVSAQLIDATTGSHIWAERYDREVTEIFAVQDEIAEAVATAIHPAVAMRNSGVRYASRRPSSVFGRPISAASGICRRARRPKTSGT